jgi:hypothetical protein
VCLLFRPSISGNFANTSPGPDDPFPLARSVPRWWRVAGVEVLQSLGEQCRNRPVPVPLAVGGNDPPRRVWTSAGGQGGVVGGQVGMPASAFSDVLWIDFQDFLGLSSLARSRFSSTSGEMCRKHLMSSTS